MGEFTPNQLRAIKAWEGARQATRKAWCKRHDAKVMHLRAIKAEADAERAMARALHPVQSQGTPA